MKARRQPASISASLRARAEQLVGTTQREVVELSPAEGQKLVHDLQVHQIELEMQNDELRRKQLELEEARNRYADLYDFSPAAYLTINPHNEILEANVNAGELLGQEPRRLLQQKFTRFVPAEAQDTFYLFCRQVFSSDGCQNLDLELVAAHGQRLCVHLQAVREVTVPRMQCRLALTNISERKQLERSLRENQQFAQSVVDSLAASIAILDEAGLILSVNEQWRDFAACNGAVMEAVCEGTNYLTACAASAQNDPDVANLIEALREMLAGRRRDFRCEYPCHSPTEQRWFSMRATPFSEQGRRRVVVAHEDISERKQAEIDLFNVSQFNQQIIAGAKEGIIVYGRDLKYQVWNPFMEQLTGISAAEVLGKHPLEIFPFLQTTGVLAQLERVLAGKSVETAEFYFPATRKGHAGWVADTNSPLRNEHGDITGIIGIVTVITERKLAEARIARLDHVKSLLMGVDHAIVHLADQDALLNEVCRVAVEPGGFKLAWIGMVTPAGAVQPVAQAGAIRYLKGICIVARDEPEGRGAVGTAIRENRVVVIEDVQLSSHMKPWQERLREFGLNNLVAFPIRTEGQVVGAFAVYAANPGFFDENELSLLTQVCEELSFALTAMAGQAARKQAEAELRRSEQDLSIFFNQAPIGVVWLSASGTILRANLAQLDLLGYSPENYLGKSFLEFCVEPAEGHELLKRLAAKETINNFPMARRCQNGQTRHVLVDAVAFWREGQFQYGSVFLRDITDRIKLEKEILQVGEQERLRMARDLHDGLGQLLVGAAYLTGILRQDLAAQARPESRRMARVQEVINEAIQQTRNLARGLHPVAAEPNGLMVALQTLAERTKELFHVDCRFTCQRPVLIQSQLVATHLFRIAQEAVTNAIKHAQPRRISIGLTETRGRIVLAIKDDGDGRPARRWKKTGMGLRILRYRAGMIGGSLAIQIRPAGGTTIVCTVPLTGARSLPPPPEPKPKKRTRKD